MDLRDSLRAMRTGWWLIVLLTALCLGAAGAATVRATTTYSTTVTMVVTSAGTSDSTLAAYQGNLLSAQRVKSYADLLTSERIAGAVISRLGLADSPAALASRISAVAVPDTVLLRATVSDQAPRRAQEIADAVGAEFSAAVDQIEAPAPGAPPTVKVSVWEPAKLPISPVSPRPVRNIGLGLLLGLLLGAGAAVLRSTLDTTLRTAADVREAVDLPVLGTIGFDPDCARRPLIVQGRADAPRAEALRELRTNLQFVDVDDPPRSIVMTSCVRGEGKTTTAANLAITLTQAGSRVLLIDGDLRRPALAEQLGIEGAVGLTSVLVGAAELDDVVQPWGDGRLEVLPSGPLPPNPSELLGSKGMAGLLKRLEAGYDLVLIDAPPLLPVTDAAVLAAVAGGVLVVTRARRTRREQLQRATQALQAVDARLLGIVLNMLPTRGPDAYRYGYGYGRLEAQEPTGARHPVPEALELVPSAHRRRASRAVPADPLPEALSRESVLVGQTATSGGTGGGGASSPAARWGGWIWRRREL